MEHAFIFSPGIWEGKGTITFTMAEDVLEFLVRWVTLPPEDHTIRFQQEVDIKTFPEKMHNHFTLWQKTPSTFDIQLENQTVSQVIGSGLITPKAIAWEFTRKDQEFEGFEIYEIQPDGSYKMRAEFTAGGGMSTQVSGFIFRQG